MSKKKAPTSIPCELPLALDPSVSARPPDRPVASQSSARPPFPAASAAAAAPAAAPAVRSLVANSSGMDTRFDEDERTTAATRRRQSPSPSFAPSTSTATAVGLTRYGAVKSWGPRRELETGETSRCMEVLLLENPIDATKPSPLHVDEDKQGEVIGGTQQNAPESCVTERARLNLKSRSSAVGQSAGSPLKERILAPSTAMKRTTENKYLANLKTYIVEKALKYDRKEKMKEVIHEADDIPEEGFVLEPTGHGNGKQFRLPHSVYDVLHTYQKEGIKWLWTLHLKKLGGALCDEMGMGKTRQVAAFLRGLLQADVIHNAMIICPVTVIETWCKELNIVGVLVIKVFRYDRRTDCIALKSIATDGGVLITTFEAVRDHIHRILETGGTAWDYIVIDEAHRMKNDRTKLFDSLCRIDCTHRILMTGTLIQNNLTEFYALMNFCCPNLLGESGQFHENFSMPIERARYRGASAQLIKESIEASEEYLYTNLIMSNVLGDEPGTPLAASQVARSICNHPVMVIGSDFEQRGESEEKKDALTDIIRKGLLADQL
uniref:Helicase ATP-binding domain-containing protein n=1 Tax=Oryza barthii TaxID=65489 RepID=A0A0D3GVD3_9ORYZ